MQVQSEVSSQTPARPGIADFWAAPPDALFPRVAVASVLSKSVSWLERAALTGDGPAFCKLGRHSLYRKRDVLEFIEKTASRRVTSTSELQGVPAA